MLEDLFMSVGFLPLLSGRRRVRWLVGITIVLLAWLTVSFAVAFRLTVVFAESSSSANHSIFLCFVKRTTIMVKHTVSVA